MKPNYSNTNPGLMSAQAAQAPKGPRTVRSAVNGAPVATWKGAVTK